MRLPFIGKINTPAPDPSRDHVGAGIEQMIAAELPRAAAEQRRLQAVIANEKKRQRAENIAVAAMFNMALDEGDL